MAGVRGTRRVTDVSDAEEEAWTSHVSDTYDPFGGNSWRAGIMLFFVGK